MNNMYACHKCRFNEYTLLNIGTCLRPATHYQVDLTGTPSLIRLSGLPDSVCVLISNQLDLTGGPDQVYLSGIPDSEPWTGTTNLRSEVDPIPLNLAR
jgi:hypothetical protein